MSPVHRELDTVSKQSNRLPCGSQMPWLLGDSLLLPNNTGEEHRGSISSQGNVFIFRNTTGQEFGTEVYQKPKKDRLPMKMYIGVCRRESTRIKTTRVMFPNKVIKQIVRNIPNKMSCHWGSAEKPTKINSAWCDFPLSCSQRRKSDKDFEGKKSFHDFPIEINKGINQLNNY